MVKVYKKRNTVWSFCVNGAAKENKSGKFFYPEMGINTPLGQAKIKELEEKEWEPLFTEFVKE